MNLRRGDVVLAFYPFATGAGAKKRPVLVVQNDRENRRLDNAIVAQITSNTKHSQEPTHLLIEVASGPGKQSGLLADSVISCVNLATVHESRIVRTIGSLPPSIMSEVDLRLKSALDLSSGIVVESFAMGLWQSTLKLGWACDFRPPV